MKRHIYNYAGFKAEDQFSYTTKEVAGYIDHNYQMDRDMKVTVEMLIVSTITILSDPPRTGTLTRKKIWEEEVKLYVKKKMTLADNNKKLWSLIWGQCSNAMQAKFEKMGNHETIRHETNGWDSSKISTQLSANFKSKKCECGHAHSKEKGLHVWPRDQHVKS